MSSIIYVFLGGGVGSLCRYGISEGFSFHLLSFLPPPRNTLIANIISCFILGILIGFNSKHLITYPQRLLFMTGFCGGFSTFSTFSGEIVQLYQSGQQLSAINYLVISMAAGIVSILGGLYLVRLMT